MPLWLVTRTEDQSMLMMEFHKSPWSDHRGTWATFEKLKEKHWCQGLYKDVHHFLSTCGSCQMNLVVLHSDELHPTYPPTIHFKWMVDLVTMSMGE